MGQSKIYALLIGINKYDYYEEKKGEYDLEGCVQDSMAMAAYLKETIANASERLFIQNLHSPKSKTKEENPTDCAFEAFSKANRKNIIKGFQKFLTQATADDTVLIYYSGHGLKYEQPEALWHLSQEQNAIHQGQSLMCADAFTEKKGKWITAIKDWEIRWLMQEIVEKANGTPHILMLSDCCHSSGNNRDFNKASGIKVRGLSNLKSAKSAAIEDLKEFLFYQKSKKSKKLLKKTPSAFELPEARHIALSAANNYELAKEDNFPEGRFGVFTYYLLKNLRAAKGNINYRILTKLIRAQTANKVSFQHPQYYATFPADAESLFLGGAVAQQDKYYLLRPLKGTSKQDKGILDAGSLHGIPLIQEEKTEISIFPVQKAINTATESVCKGYLTKVGAQESIVQLANGETFPTGQSFFKAVISAMPVPKTKVSLIIETDQPTVAQPTLQHGMALLKKALLNNPFLAVVEKERLAQYHLYAYQFEGQEKYRITKKDQLKALVAPKIGFTEDTAALFIKEMEHIARWERTWDLQNPNPKIIQAGDIELVVLDKNDQPIQTNNNGLIELTATETAIPELKFKVQMHNQAQVPLYCALLHLSSNYGIETSYLDPETHLGKKDYLDGDKNITWEQWEAYAFSHISVNGENAEKGRAIGFTVPNEKFQQGIRTTEDHFKLIVSTKQFDARHLYQGNLQNPKGDRDFSQLPVNSALDALMQTIQTRTSTAGVKSTADGDWWTSLVTIRTTRDA